MYLKEIIEHKRSEIKNLVPAEQNRQRPVIDPLPHLRAKPFIAEIKKASPSRGMINRDVDIMDHARIYERGGAGAVSVLTDSRYFQGSFGFLTEVSKAVNIPLLCKDFILSEVQLDNAFAHGADFILLIASILNVRELRILARRAQRYSMKVLYEIHDGDEFEKIRSLDLEMVGVNSRDLGTFTINREKAMTTIGSLNGDFMKIAESGIETGEDIITFRKAGADAFLVGTALMIADDPVEKLKEFYSALVDPCS
jgi:indole-3-glycerol phosphate synthase